MKKVYKQNDFFIIYSENIAKGHRPRMKYTLTMTHYGQFKLDIEEVRNIIDPHRNISGHKGKKWVFLNQSKVDKIYTWLRLKYE